MTNFLKTLYLFTSDDLKGIVLTNTLCGIMMPLAGSMVQPQISAKDAVMRTPLVILWVWTNLLLFNVSNQRRPEAIQEDGKNKPWRPLPAGRLKGDQARRLLIALHPIAALLSYTLGAICPCLVLQTLTFLYNDLGAGDTWILRNLVNAGGFLCFLAGAVQVTLGSHPSEYCPDTFGWMFLLGTTISSTMHIQDLYDMAGDQLRGRKTIPIVFGDSPARFSLVFLVPTWSIVAPTFWRLPAVGFLPSTALGVVIARRLLLNKRDRNLTTDKTTFRIWNIWISSLYLLPVFSYLCRGPVG